MYKLSDDVFQHTYWMNKFHNPELFPDDLYSEYSRYLRPYGVKFIYFFLTYLWNPILAGKILGVILFCLSAFLIARIGFLETKNNIYAIIYCLFFAANPTVLRMFPGGLDRAFAFPFLFIFYMGLKQKNFKLITWAIILGSLCYPLLYPLMLGVFFIYFIFTLFEDKKINLDKNGKLYILTAIFLPLILLLVKVFSRPSFLGEIMTKKEMLENPIFYPGGRSNYFPFQPYIHYLRYLFRDPLSSGLIMLGVWKIWREGNWQQAVSVFVGSFILFQLAKYFFIKLYIPGRYPRFLLTLLNILLLSQGMGYILEKCQPFFLKLILGATLIIAILHFPQNKIYPGIGNVTLKNQSLRKLCDYLKNKSPDTFIASPPHIGDFISTFSEKKVLLKYELTQGWFKNYFKIVSERTLDFFKMYYATTPEEIINFISKYKINYILVNLYFFHPKVLETKRVYIEPFNSYIQNNILNKKHSFIILKYLPYAEFSAGENFLIPARAFFSPPPVAKPSNVFMPYPKHKCQI